jgi:hypothetical protein
MGWSSGPWYAAQLAVRDGRVRAIVSISGAFDFLDDRTVISTPDSDRLWQAFQEARWRAGKLASNKQLTWPGNWTAESSVFRVAHLIQCPMLLVYAALEPDAFRAQAEELKQLVSRAETRVWHSGIHALLNVPEALEDAAEWMKQQLLGT